MGGVPPSSPIYKILEFLESVRCCYGINIDGRDVDEICWEVGCFSTALDEMGHGAPAGGGRCKSRYL